MRDRRLLFLTGVGVTAVLLGVLGFGNLNRNLVYYLTPSEALAKRASFPDGRRFRLGGQVVPGSLTRLPAGVGFTVTDGTRTVSVTHRGSPPQLFGEGIGVVVEGSWSGDRFSADTMLVKHDETYRPPADGATAGPPMQAGP
jgi:cytochrome c-type biogenesis protein CcmE